jgi:hypothetical protein
MTCCLCITLEIYIYLYLMLANTFVQNIKHTFINIIVGSISCKSLISNELGFKKK